MSDERFALARRLFEEAAELPTRRRADFLARECAGDPQLYTEVQALLDADQTQDSAVDLTFSQLTNLIRRHPDTDSLPFATCGDYRLVRRLGGGGMGEVFLAERIENGNLVAIKVLRRESGSAPDIVRRFEREKELLGRLQHPNIARFYHSGIESERPWFAMDYIEGRPIDAYCKVDSLPLRTRLELVGKLSAAVAHAHAKLIAHCDLTPNNILVTPDGEPHLVDFGISRTVSEAPGAPRLTSGSRPYSVDYASPEQIQNKPLDTKTDAWSLGAILYTLFADGPPFVAEGILSDRAIEDKILNDEPLPPSAAANRRGVPSSFASPADWKEIDTLCLWALRKEPENRCRVDQLGDDIGRFLRTEPLQARPAGWRYVAGKFLRRNKTWVFAATAVFVAIAGLVAFYTLRLAKARDQALAESARTQRVERFMLNLFDNGDKEAGPADSLRVVTLLDRGAQEANSLDNEPVVQADLYQTLGGMYQKLGRFDQAEPLLESALERRKASFGSDHAEVAASQLALGMLRTDQAHLDEAERLIRETVAMNRRLLAPDDPAATRASDALGRVLNERGQYDKALEVLTEAVRRQSGAGGAKSDLAASLIDLADSHFYLGHYAISDSLNKQALAMHRQLHGETHPLVANDLVNLGNIQFQLGHYHEAELYDRRALEISRLWYGKDHPETARDATYLAQALSMEERYTEASALLEAALSTFEQAYGKAHPRVALTLNELGAVAQYQGNLDEAAADFNRMAEIYKTVYGDQHQLTALALANLATVYLKQGQFSRAEALFRDVIRRDTTALPANHLSVGVARVKLGRTLLLEKRYEDAESETLAGYGILAKQTSPSVDWLVQARKDLVKEYEALNMPEKAAEFRTKSDGNGGAKGPR
jgi:serine/threonine-protein kinase